VTDNDSNKTREGTNDSHALELEKNITQDYIKNKLIVEYGLFKNTNDDCNSIFGDPFLTDYDFNTLFVNEMGLLSTETFPLDVTNSPETRGRPEKSSESTDQYGTISNDVEELLTTDLPNEDINFQLPSNIDFDEIKELSSSITHELFEDLPLSLPADLDEDIGKEKDPVIGIDLLSESENIATIEVPIVNVDPETFDKLTSKMNIEISNYLPPENYGNYTLFLDPDIDSKTVKTLENANSFLNNNNLLDEINSHKQGRKRKSNNERSKEYRERRKNNLTEKDSAILELEEENHRLKEQEKCLVTKKIKLQNWYLDAIANGKIVYKK